MIPQQRSAIGPTIVPAAGLAVLIGLLSAGQGPAAASPAVVKATSLNVRIGPGLNHRIIARLPRGMHVRAFDCGDEWCRVRFRGFSGYAAAVHLDRADGSYASAEPVPEPESNAEAPPSDPGARLWRWDDRKARDSQMRARQWHWRHR